MNNLRKFQQLLEGISQQDLADILCARLETRYPDIYNKYDYDTVYRAVDDVASFHSGAEELGTSDIGMMLRSVIKRLEEYQGVAEGADEQKYMAVYNKHFENPSYRGKPITADGKVIYVTASSKEEASRAFAEKFMRAQIISSMRGKFDVVVVPKDESGGGGVAEGAKVDRMVKHIAKSERESGKSKDEAENIAWATVNKRGYLDNTNKKGHK